MELPVHGGKPVPRMIGVEKGLKPWGQTNGCVCRAIERGVSACLGVMAPDRSSSAIACFSCTALVTVGGAAALSSNDPRRPPVDKPPILAPNARDGIPAGFPAGFEAVNAEEEPPCGLLLL